MRRLPLLLVCVVVPLLASCQQEEISRTRKKGWFEGLPGVERGGVAVKPDSSGSAATVAFGSSTLSEDRLRTPSPAGSPSAPQPTLIAQTGRHLMVHIYETLRDNERELFADQVLSQRTRSEFQQRGLPHTDAFDLLKAMEEEVVAFLQAAPDAERSPGVQVLPLGGRVQRVLAPRNAQMSLRLVAMDMVMEGGSWRLRWFVPAPGYQPPAILEPWERDAIAAGASPDTPGIRPSPDALPQRSGVSSGLAELLDTNEDEPGDSGPTPAKPSETARPAQPPR